MEKFGILEKRTVTFSKFWSKDLEWVYFFKQTAQKRKQTLDWVFLQRF